MGFEEDLQAILEADPNIAAIVDDRITRIHVPEGDDFPALSWFRVSGSRIDFHKGEATYRAWAEPRYQFDCWAKTIHEATDLARAVITALSGLEGFFGESYLGYAFVVNELETYEQSTETYRRVVEFRMGYEDDVVEAS